MASLAHQDTLDEVLIACSGHHTVAKREEEEEAEEEGHVQRTFTDEKELVASDFFLSFR